MLQKLKQLGPLKEEDPRLVVNLSQEGRRLVMDKKGMINFLKVAVLLLILSCYLTILFRMTRDLDPMPSMCA